jgi:hypothetical protein
VLAPTRWALRRAIVIINETLRELRVEQPPDKTSIGRIERGFTFLGYWITAKGATGAAPSVGQMQIREFQVLSIMTGGNQVAVEFVIEADTPGGGHYRDEEMHLWTFDAAGKVTRSRHYIDTVKHADAARKWPAA